MGENWGESGSIQDPPGGWGFWLIVLFVVAVWIMAGGSC